MSTTIAFLLGVVIGILVICIILRSASVERNLDEAYTEGYVNGLKDAKRELEK